MHTCWSWLSDILPYDALLQNCFLWELLVMEDRAKMKWELVNW